MGKKSSPPPAPDYTSLAKQQAEMNKEVAQENTLANRVDQYNPYGSLTWSQDPSTGQWTQIEQYAPEVQEAINNALASQQQMSGLLGGLTDRAGQVLSQPIDPSQFTQVQGYTPGQMPGQGLPNFGQIDMSQLGNWGNVDFSGLGAMPDAGFGAVEQVRDAMMSRLQPGLDQGRSAEIQRLKAQGITEGTPAWQAAMQSQNQRANDANQQALLGAAGEYGNIYNRTLAGRQQGVNEQMLAANFANALRGQQFGEQNTLANLADRQRSQLFDEQSDLFNMHNTQQGLIRGAQADDRAREIAEMQMYRQQPLNELNALRGYSSTQGPSFENYNQATGYGAADIYGASQNQYQAAMNNYNASQARKGGLMSGLFGLAGAALGGPLGGMAGNALGGLFGGGGGGGGTFNGMSAPKTGFWS